MSIKLKQDGTVPVTGVWVRKVGETIEVLLEIEHDGMWRRVVNQDLNQPISVILESEGIVRLANAATGESSGSSERLRAVPPAE